MLQSLQLLGGWKGGRVQDGEVLYGVLQSSLSPSLWLVLSDGDEVDGSSVGGGGRRRRRRRVCSPFFLDVVVPCDVGRGLVVTAGARTAG